MSIGYDSKAVIYNAIGGELDNPLTWYGHELTNVRVELITKAAATTSGTTSATTCSIKVYDKDLGSVAAGRPEWEADPEGRVLLEPNTVFVITEKEDLHRSVEVPTGKILDSEYDAGFLDYLSTTYGMTYKATTAEHYSLIPHWVLSGS